MGSLASLCPPAWCSLTEDTVGALAPGLSPPTLVNTVAPQVASVWGARAVSPAGRRPGGPGTPRETPLPHLCTDPGVAAPSSSALISRLRTAAVTALLPGDPPAFTTKQWRVRRPACHSALRREVLPRLLHAEKRGVRPWGGQHPPPCPSAEAALGRLAGRQRPWASEAHCSEFYARQGTPTFGGVLRPCRGVLVACRGAVQLPTPIGFMRLYCFSET